MKTHPNLLLIAATLGVAALTGCAQTVFYRDGHRIAAFQADMKNVDYSMASDGSVRWRAASVDHSTPTRAQGEAASMGTAAAASGLTLFLK